jgi:cysteine desulfurase
MTTSGDIYLDNNATTRPFPEVIDTVARHLRENYANPGSRHRPGQAARKVLEEARETIARILGAAAGEVVFTSGGTESINLALFGLAQGKPGTILLTAGEHPATLESCRRLQRDGWNLHFLHVDGEGLLIPEQYDRLPWGEIRLVSLILAHNETGVIQNIAPLAERCRAHGVPIHLDAVQAVGRFRSIFTRSGCGRSAWGRTNFTGRGASGRCCCARGPS